MKVLFVNYAMNIGGIESFLLNITRELRSHNIDVDFLCYHEEEFALEKELTNLGCHFHRLSDPDHTSILKHIKQLKTFFKNNKYDVVHANTYTDSGAVLYAAYLSGISVRVAHSHTSQKPKSFKQKMKWFIAKILIKIFANRKIACSKIAGKSLFIGNKYTILENGVDLSKYIYNKNLRCNIRNKYNIKEDEIVIGHVGRFAKVKNHKYIIDLFSKLDDNYRLLLVGDGPEFNSIKELVSNYELDSKVIFTGSVFNAYEYFNAMDLILFPSFYEGLPVSLVEAQMNGLQIIASDTVSNEINLFGNVKFFNLNDDVNNVIKLVKEINSRNSNLEYFEKSNYNIKNTYEKLIEIYKK